MKKMKSTPIRLMLIFLLIGGLGFMQSGCTSKKKLAEQARQAHIQEAKTRLIALLNDDGSMTIGEMEQEVAEIKGWNLQDEEVDKLIAKAEKKIEYEKQRLEKEKLKEEAIIKLLALLNDKSLSVEELEEGLAEVKAMGLEDEEIDDMIARLEQRIKEMKAFKDQGGELQEYLDEIGSMARNGNIDGANRMISECLQKFEGPEVPVLIIISIEGDIIDYDKPTTAGKYLNYLKDVKNSPNKVYRLKKSDMGKIIELELIKK
jgi:hypothetical protein